MQLKKYRVVITTSDIRGAGTDSQVFIDIQGTKGFSGKTILETNADNFSRALEDTFEVECGDIGDIEGVVLGHDGSGWGPSWHCK